MKEIVPSSGDKIFKRASERFDDGSKERVVSILNGILGVD